jgi:hypothetical protein
MSTIYSGDGTVPTASQVRQAIVSSTNATPIKVEVTGHGLSDGDFVEVAGHQINTSANGRWVIEVVDANHFNLLGSAGVGIGAGSGYVISYAVHPRTTLPADLVDDRDAASVNVMAESAQDKIAFLYEKVGTWRAYYNDGIEITDDTWASWSTNAPGIFNAAAWASVSNGNNLFNFSSPGPVANDGDEFEIWATFTVATTGGTGLAAVGIGMHLDVMANPATLVVGSAVRLVGANQTFHSVSLHARRRITGGSNNRLWDIAIMGYGNVGSPQNVNFVGHRSLTVHQLRGN